jgi:hypothetical protein
MKDKISIIIVILIAVFIILWQPWFVSNTENGEVCHNIFGVTMKCR